MLLATGEPPCGDEWGAEVKWDGFRAQVRVDRGRLTVRSRRGRDCTEEFRELAELVACLGRRRLLLAVNSSALHLTARPTSPRCGHGSAPAVHTESSRRPRW